MNTVKVVQFDLIKTVKGKINSFFIIKCKFNPYYKIEIRRRKSSTLSYFLLIECDCKKENKSQLSFITFLFGILQHH